MIERFEADATLTQSIIVLMNKFYRATEGKQKVDNGTALVWRSSFHSNGGSFRSYFFATFPNRALVSEYASNQMARLGLIPSSYATVCFEPTVELHRTRTF